MQSRTHILLIPLVTLLVTGYYAYFGQMVPQKEVHPPKDAEISENVTTEEMVAVGKEIFNGKGTCTVCHRSGEGARAPELAQIGSIAGARKPGTSDIEYLAESLYRPGDYVVKGFQPIMPQMDIPPIGLSDDEIKAVIAFLQSSGGTATITLDTKLKWETGKKSTPKEDKKEATAGSQKFFSPTELLNQHLCITCHNTDKPGNLVGPSLFDVGKRLSKAEIYEALMDPDAKVSEGFSAGMMGASLGATGFYNKVTSEELKQLVDTLANQKGN